MGAEALRHRRCAALAGWLCIAALAFPARARGPAPPLPSCATWPDGSSAVVVLAYHGVVDCAPARAKQYRMPLARLTQQLEWLRANGYTTIDPDVWIDAMEQGQPVDPKRVILTFDDGHKSDYQIVAPLLERYGFRGVFFIPTAFLNARKAAAYRDLVKRGHRVGSHTVHHFYLTMKGRPRVTCGRVAGCTDDDIRQELVGSRTALAERVAPTDLLAWPGNYFDERTIRLAREAGYRGLFACEKQVRSGGLLLGVPGTTTSPDIIYRVEVDGRCSLAAFARSVVTQRGCAHSERRFHRCFIPQWTPPVAVPASTGASSHAPGASVPQAADTLPAPPARSQR